MVLGSTSMDVVEQFPPNGCCQCLCRQGELQLPFACLGDSPRLAGGSDQCPFKLLLLPFILKHVRVCMYPLRGYFSQHSETPTSKPTWPSKPSTLKTPWCRPPGLGTPVCSKNWLPLRENLCNYDYPPVVFCPPGVWFCFLTNQLEKSLRFSLASLVY